MDIDRFQEIVLEAVMLSPGTPSVVAERAEAMLAELRGECLYGCTCELCAEFDRQRAAGLV
jgi:hypothetical protein